MNARKRWILKWLFAVGMYLLSSACGAGGEVTQPEGEESPPETIVITEIVAFPPTSDSTEESNATSICPTPGSFETGEIDVVPLGSPGRVCAKRSTAEDWETMQGEINHADWGFGVGTFFDLAANVHLPEDELILLMQPNSEIKIPDAPKGNLELIVGRLQIQWKKTVGNIVRIIAGGNIIDPDFAVFEFSYYPEQGTAEVTNYAGEVIAGSPKTVRPVRLGPWQKTDLASADGAITGVVAPPPLEVQEWLRAQGLPVDSPWKIEVARNLEKQPALDPLLATDASSQQILHLLMEGLFAFDPEGNLSPAGADDDTANEDFTTFTFHLREDAEWSDGEPVIAQQYVEGICRSINYARRGEPSALLQFDTDFEWLKGVQGQTNCEEGITVSVVDDYTLVLNLDQPLADIRNLLTSPLMYPFRRDIIDRCGEEKWTEPDCFVGNGPYKLESGKIGESLTLVKNPYYWNAQTIDDDTRLEFTITATEQINIPSPTP